MEGVEPAEFQIPPELSADENLNLPGHENPFQEQGD
jgi:hypothetical protein